jgi:hypothetical protein
MVTITVVEGRRRVAVRPKPIPVACVSEGNRGKKG